MTTTNKSLATPANNSYIDTWDVPMNANFTSIDGAFGGLTTINVVSASGTVVLTSAQYTPPNIVLTGALTANVIYQVPAGVGGFWFVLNSTSGAYTITFSSASGGTTASIPQGYGSTIVCDPTNGVRFANTIPAGAAGSTGQIQYNSSGVLAGSSNLTYSGGNLAFSGGNFSVGGNVSWTGSLTSVLTVSASAKTTPAAVTFSATAMTVNCSLSNVFTTTFSANVTVAPTISNPGNGQTINWYITQDATGSRTMTWPASFKWPGGTAGVLSTAANSVDLVVASYRSATGNWYATLLKGFA